MVRRALATQGIDPGRLPPRSKAAGIFSPRQAGLGYQPIVRAARLAQRAVHAAGDADRGDDAVQELGLSRYNAAASIPAMESDYQRRLTVMAATAAFITAIVGIVAALTGFIPWSSNDAPPVSERPLLHGR